MSVVIGVCGEDFCTLFTDNWRVVSEHTGLNIQHESTENVSRINEHLLMGATGVFGSDETAGAPLNETDCQEPLCLSDASARLIRFMDQNHACLREYGHRNYLLGGINLRGQFCIRELHFNSRLGYTEIATHHSDSTHRYTMALSIPFFRPDQQRSWLNRIRYAALNCRTHDELILTMTRVILALHSVDSTTGDQIQYASLFSEEAGSEKRIHEISGIGAQKG